MQIEIHDFQVLVRLGCTEEERAFPQLVTFQLELVLGTTRSGETDDIADTVDYMDVLARVEESCRVNEYKLLEYLATEVGKACLKCSATIESVKVSCRKHLAPNTGGVSVEVSVS